MRRSLLVSLGLAVLLSLSSQSGRADEVRVAIGGYDTVAYFTDAKPVPGRSDIDYVWHNTRWQFATAAHRDLFARDPEHYAPQYDGYCAMGASWEKDAHKDIADPQAWAIVDGKLYLTHSEKALARWREHPYDNIKRADQNWSEVKKQDIIYDGFPNHVAAKQ